MTCQGRALATLCRVTYLVTPLHLPSTAPLHPRGTCEGVCECVCECVWEWWPAKCRA